MQDSLGVSRRTFFRYGLGASSILLSSPVFGKESCDPTLAQTSGPFMPQAFGSRYSGPFFTVEDQNNDLTFVEGKETQDRARGLIMYVRGKVTDSQCRPVSRSIVFLWQTDSNGHYNHMGDSSVRDVDELDPNFQYWGVAKADEQGNFEFKTIVPHSYQASFDWVRPPHFHFMVQKEGFETLITQTYFEGDDIPGIQEIRFQNEADWILNMKGPFRPSYIARKNKPNNERLKRLVEQQWKQNVIRYRKDSDYSDGLVGDLTLVLGTGLV